jgi:pimeloyl-ACP methyl ester carboxylesterase
MRRWARAGLLAAAALLAASCTSAPPPPPKPATAVPIIFVHGYGESGAVFDKMIAHLEGRGYPEDYLMAVNLNPADGGNIAAAERQLAPAVDELIARTGGGPDTKVDIVAHSMGALSSRWYANRLHPERVRTIFTIGGANHGTNVLCGHPGDGAKDLCPAFATDPGNQAQSGLNGAPRKPVDETPWGIGQDDDKVRSVPPDEHRAIRYITMTVPNDQWIQPVASARLNGTGPAVDLTPGTPVEQPTPGNLVFSAPTDHDAILQNDQLFAVLDVVLAGGSLYVGGQ